MVAIKSGYAVTTLVNGEVNPNYTTEKTNNNTTIGKMIIQAEALLTRTGTKGVNGVVGTYDITVLGDACYRLVHGSRVESVYGTSLEAVYFEKAKIL